MAERFDPGAFSVPRQIRRHPRWVLVPGILWWGGVSGIASLAIAGLVFAG